MGNNNLLSGIFTVNDNGKKVRFTMGNLFWNGSAFAIEDNQLAFPTSWDANHVGHFFWSKDAGVARAESYNDPSRTTTDKFFAADGRAIEGLTVPTLEEWRYLLRHNLAVLGTEQYRVIVNGIKGCILKPNGYTGTVKATYTLDEWNDAEAEGLVFLPFAGFRHGSKLNSTGIFVFLWTASPYGHSERIAISASVDSSYWYVGNYYRRYYGFSVRLVEVIQED